MSRCITLRPWLKPLALFGMLSTENLNDPSPFLGTKLCWQGLKRAGRHRKLVNKLN